MSMKSTLLLATALAFAGSAIAASLTPFAPDSVSRAIETAAPYYTAVQPEEPELILVQNRGRSGGGGGQRAAGGGGQRSAGTANRGGNFSTNDFHRDVSNSRNVNVSGGCCNGNYDSGPNWGGVAAGVAVGAVVGAAANSAAQTPTYAAPPPTYPPGYVAPPPY